VNTKELQRNFDDRWPSTRDTDRGFWILGRQLWRLSCYAVSSGKLLPTSRKIAVPSYSQVVIHLPVGTA